MDPFHADDLRRAIETPPAEKLRQACELLALGMRLKKQDLERRDPGATPEEIDARLLAWCLREESP